MAPLIETKEEKMGCDLKTALLIMLLPFCLIFFAGYALGLARSVNPTPPPEVNLGPDYPRQEHVRKTK